MRGLAVSPKPRFYSNLPCSFTMCLRGLLNAELGSGKIHSGPPQSVPVPERNRVSAEKVAAAGALGQALQEIVVRRKCWLGPVRVRCDFRSCARHD